MPLLKSEVSHFSPQKFEVFLVLCCLLASNCLVCGKSKLQCDEGEITYKNSANKTGCVNVVPKSVNDKEHAEFRCMSGEFETSNLAIFVDEKDALQFVQKSKLPYHSEFFVDYKAVSVTSNELNSGSVTCFVPTVEDRDEKKTQVRTHHYLPDLFEFKPKISSDTEIVGPDSRSVCKEFEKNPGMFAVEDLPDCVVVSVQSPTMGQNMASIHFGKSDCSTEEQNYVVCVRWLEEFECTLPKVLRDVSLTENRRFLDQETRLWFNKTGKTCIEYKCVKDDVVHALTNCTTPASCYGHQKDKACIVGGIKEDHSDPKKAEGSSASNEGGKKIVMGEATIWTIIGGGLFVFLLLILLVIYLVNTKVDGTPLPTARNVFEYWRNRQTFHQTNFEDEVVETACSAYTACNDVVSPSSSDCDILPIHQLSDDAAVRRTMSAGAGTNHNSGPALLHNAVGGSFYSNTEYSCPPSHASSLYSVTGEPPPSYLDEFSSQKRPFYHNQQQHPPQVPYRQRRLDSTNSINSAGEVPPAYTSRPVSAASSLASVLTAGLGSTHFPQFGSRFNSINNMAAGEDIRMGKQKQRNRSGDAYGYPQMGGAGGMFGNRDRNPSGKKQVKFDNLIRSQNSNDIADRSRKRHASDMPAASTSLSQSAGNGALQNAFSNALPGPLGGPRTRAVHPGSIVGTAEVGLKPAIRTRHRSEEQNRSMGGGMFAPTPPAIQPPPPNPGSRLLRNSNGEMNTGSLFSGSSKDILDEISRLSPTENGPTRSKAFNAGELNPGRTVESERIVPAKVFGPSTRYRHVSAEQTLPSTRKRLDSDLVQLLDDQSSASGSTPIRSGDPTVNPFFFNTRSNSGSLIPRPDSKQSPVTTEKVLHDFDNPRVGFLSPNAPGTSQYTQNEPRVVSLNNQNQRFSDQDLATGGSNQNAAQVSHERRPRSQSVTDQSRQSSNDLVLPESINNTERSLPESSTSALTNNRRTSPSLTQTVFNRATGPNTGSKSKQGGAVNASYEEESMC